VEKVLCGVLWRGDGRGGVLTLVQVVPFPPASTPVPSETVLRASPFLWNVVSTHHVEPLFQRRGIVSIAFPLPTNCLPHVGGGGGGRVWSERVHSDLPSVVLAHPFLSLLRIRST
jgi:hypothetical protein